jgi:2-haloacid dehalogenase
VSPHAVIFDLGNVLIDWDMKPSFRPHFESEAEVEAFLTWFSPFFMEHVHDGRGDLGASLAPLRTQFPDKSHLFDVFEHRWHNFMKGPIVGTVDILHRLDARGTPLFALTNWPHQVWPPRGPEDADPADHDYSFMSRFADIVVSGQVAMRKPDDDIYLHALEKFGLAAAEAVFVDDLAENVVAANGLGITGLQFVSPEKLESDLAELGFL